MRSLLTALLALAIVGCSAPAATAPTITPAAVTSSAAPTATPTRMPPPTPTPISELTQVFRPLATSWRPVGPTLLFATSEDGASTLVAVPFGPNGRTAEPTRLVTFQGHSWDLRSDGGALVVEVGTATGARLAAWDIIAGAGRWITAGAFVSTPVWSKDGRSIYFGSYPSRSTDPGEVRRIGADGQGLATIATLDRLGGLEGLTPDGRGLIWTKGQAGGSAEILDIATGKNTHLDDVARIVSWRAQQPRILLAVGGCCAGRPGGSLVAFDDATLTSRSVADRSPAGAVAFGGGAWDPSGTRIAAARYDENTPYDALLVTIDPASGATQPLSDVLGVGAVLWVEEGIIVTRTLARSASSSVDLVPPRGGPSITLYGGAAIHRVVVVRP